MPDYLDPTRYLGNIQNHQRMYEFERDILRVKNPLDADFTFIYDMLPIVVPANGTRDMERYLFRRYLWQMMGHIYNQLTEDRFEVAHEKFSKSHPDVLEDPYLLNEQIWLRLPRFDDPEFQRKVHDDCLVGVVTKFGANRVLPNAPKNGQLDPNTPLFQQLINEDKSLIDGSLPDEVELTTPTQAMPAATEEITLG